MLELTTAELRQLQGYTAARRCAGTVDKSRASSRPENNRLSRKPQAKRGATGRTVESLPGHVWALIALLTVAAYLLLAVGWSVSALGNAVFSIGEQVNAAKWRIE